MGLHLTSANSKVKNKSCGQFKLPFQLFFNHPRLGWEDSTWNQVLHTIRAHSVISKATWARPLCPRGENRKRKTSLCCLGPAKLYERETELLISEYVPVPYPMTWGWSESLLRGRKPLEGNEGRNIYSSIFFVFPHASDHHIFPCKRPRKHQAFLSMVERRRWKPRTFSNEPRAHTTSVNVRAPIAFVSLKSPCMMMETVLGDKGRAQWACMYAYINSNVVPSSESTIAFEHCWCYPKTKER